MQLRKRTISAVTEGFEHGVPPPETPSPRKARKPRRPAANLSETENTSILSVASDKQMKESMGDAERKELGKAEDSCPIPLAGGIQVQKVEKGPDVAEENEVSEVVQEGVATCKKRRRVNSVLQRGTRKGKQNEEVEPLQHNSTEQGVQVITPEGMKSLCDRDKNGTQDPTGVMDPDDPSQMPATRGPALGIVLPFQKKDIHTGGEADDSNKPSSSIDVLTPKRQRCSSNQESDVLNTQESPTRRSPRGIGKETPIKPGDSELREAPAYPTRKRTRVTYKDEDEEIESAFPSPQGRAALASSQSQNTKKNSKASAGKDRLLEQPSPKARKGRKGIWDKEVLLTSKNSKLAMAADLTVSC